MKKIRTRHILAVGTATLAASTPAWALFQEVPEPNILALFGAGLAGAILVARYINKK